MKIKDFVKDGDDVAITLTRNQFVEAEAKVLSQFFDEVSDEVPSHFTAKLGVVLTVFSATLTKELFPKEKKMEEA